ncbi:hypothetical protein GCM10009780_71200 [Actinomadura alba]
MSDPGRTHRRPSDLGTRILWRIAYLPYRDWRPRSDETDGWIRITDTDRASQLPIYVARKGPGHAP